MKSSTRVRGQTHVSRLTVELDTPAGLESTVACRLILSPTCLQMMPAFEKYGFASQVSTNLVQRSERRNKEFRLGIHRFRWRPPRLHQFQKSWKSLQLLLPAPKGFQTALVLGEERHHGIVASMLGLLAHRLEERSLVDHQNRAPRVATLPTAHDPLASAPQVKAACLLFARELQRLLRNVPATHDQSQ